MPSSTPVDQVRAALAPAANDKDGSSASEEAPRGNDAKADKGKGGKGDAKDDAADAATGVATAPEELAAKRAAEWGMGNVETHNGLECKVSLQSYRLTYVTGTTDVFMRRRPKGRFGTASASSSGSLGKLRTKRG